MYKNLLCGVTTVVNHGPKLHIANPLMDIIDYPQSLHSIKFEKNWKLKLNNPFKRNLPCVIHVGEGRDVCSKNEIDTLLKWNLVKRQLIGVHGVAMNASQVKGFKALVWCPASNYFLFDTTATMDTLKLNSSICFGTDSTLTSDWNLWEHIRLAQNTGYVSNAELLEMLTEIPAIVWGLDRGIISKGKRADIVIARRPNANPGIDVFPYINPEDIQLILHKGEIRLFDISVLNQLISTGFSYSGYTLINMDGHQKFVQGDLKDLVGGVKNYNTSSRFPFELI
jgi:hypothetical protein